VDCVYGVGALCVADARRRGVNGVLNGEWVVIEGRAGGGFATGRVEGWSGWVEWRSPCSSVKVILSL